MNDKDIRIPKQKRSIEKKDKIKNTALKLFSDYGYFNVTTNQIAKESGISIGSLYSYFKDKKDIYDELLKDLYTKCLAALNISEVVTTDITREKIKEILLLIVKSHRYIPDFQRQIESISCQDIQYRKIEDHYRQLAIVQMKAILIKKGIPESDAIIKAYLINTIVEATVHQIVFYECKYNSDDVLNELTDMIVKYIQL